MKLRTLGRLFQRRHKTPSSRPGEAGVRSIGPRQFRPEAVDRQHKEMYDAIGIASLKD
jgi:hypothetical protein